MAVGQEFFYKLINDSLWMTSSHLDMGMFLIRKRQFAHPLAVGTDWTTADCCLQTFLEPVKLPLKKRGSKKQDVRVTEDAPLQCQAKIELYVQGLWKLGCAIPWTKVCKVRRWYNFLSLLAMHLHVFFMIRDFMRVRSFKRSRKWRLRSRTLRHGQFAGIEMFCNKLMVLHAEFLQSNSLSMPVPGHPCHTIDPSKVAYYRLKLAIEALREEAYL